MYLVRLHSVKKTEITIKGKRDGISVPRDKSTPSDIPCEAVSGKRRSINPTKNTPKETDM